MNNKSRELIELFDAWDNYRAFEHARSSVRVVLKSDARDRLNKAIDAIRFPKLAAATETDRATQEAAGRKLCGWTEDADGIWESDCGESWVFSDGGPHDNNCAFCHKCGKPLDIIPHVEETEDDK